MAMKLYNKHKKSFPLLRIEKKRWGDSIFKIGEFSRLTQVSIRMLRYYDEMNLLKPEYIDKFSGYRMYSTKQIDKLQKIIRLRDLKFNTKEIKDIIENDDEGYLISKLKEKRSIILDEIEDQKEIVKDFDNVLFEIENGKSIMDFQVTFKSVPSYKVITLRKRIPRYDMEGILWSELCSYIEDNHISMIKRKDNNMAIYYDEDYREGDVDIEVCIMTNELKENSGLYIYKETEPLPLVASMMVKGPYSNLAGAYRSFGKWLDQHDKYKMVGFNRQITHIGPEIEDDPNNYLTEIQIPVIKI